MSVDDNTFSAEKIDLAMAKAFLKTLGADGRSRFTFQTFPDSKEQKGADGLTKVIHAERNDDEDLDETLHRLAALNSKGAGIFVCANPTDGRGRKKENIAGIEYLFREIDEPDSPGAAPIAELVPHIVVLSSPKERKRHEYFRVHGAGLDVDFEGVMRRVAQDYGSDPAAKDRTRVLRVPGFLHQKGQPHMVELGEIQDHPPYQWADVTKILPPIPLTAARVETVWGHAAEPHVKATTAWIEDHREDLWTGQPIAASALSEEEFERLLARMPAPELLGSKKWKRFLLRAVDLSANLPEPPPLDLDGRDMSSVEYGIACRIGRYALEIGAPDSELCDIIERAWDASSLPEFGTREGKPSKAGTGYVQRTIERAVGALLAEQATPDQEPAPDPHDAAKRREAQREEARRIGEDGWDTDDRYQTAEIINLNAALEHFGFMSHGSQVIDLRNPRLIHSLCDWSNLYAASMESIKQGNKTRRIPVSKLWKDNIDRKHAYSVTFHPGAGDPCYDPHRRLCFNKWRPIVRKSGRSQSAQPFIDHIKHLWGDEADRFLDWLAHIEQQPGVLPHTAWLHIADNTGTGRNWISSVLARVWAGFVASNLDLAEIFRGFNNRLESKLLAQVDEIREGGQEAWANHEKFKSLLNPEFREINPKYGKKHVEHNVCRFLMFSNSILAIPLSDNDRRVEVVYHKGAPRGAAYYAKLYGLLDDRDFINAVGLWLRERDISQYNPGARAKLTAAKRSLIEANKSEVAHRVEAIMAYWPIPWINTAQLRALLHDFNHLDKQLTPHMLMALKERGCAKVTSCRQRFPDGLADVWQIRQPANPTDRTTATEAVRALYPKASSRLGEPTGPRPNHWCELLADREATKATGNA